MKSRKLLVPFDLNKPDKKIRGYLCPNFNASCIDSFYDIRSGKVWSVGMVAIIGGGVDKNDLFKEIIEYGNEKIPSVKVLLESLEEYLTMLKDFRVGSIVGIESTVNGYELIQLEKPKSNNRPRIP